MKTLGERIREAREGRGWTLEKLSTMSGVDVGTISALETRKSERSKYAQPIAAALGLSLDDRPGAYDMTPLVAKLEVGERPVAYSATGQQPWPFASITPAQWAEIPLPLRKKVEAYVQGVLAATAP